jgi:hypothetical protein
LKDVPPEVIVGVVPALWENEWTFIFSPLLFVSDTFFFGNLTENVASTSPITMNAAAENVVPINVTPPSNVLEPSAPTVTVPVALDGKMKPKFKSPVFSIVNVVTMMADAFAVAEFCASTLFTEVKPKRITALTKNKFFPFIKFTEKLLV